MKRKWLVGLALCAGGLALAQTVSKTLSLMVSGQAVSAKAYVIGGETYVPLSSLKGFGVTGSTSGNVVTLKGTQTVAGGANQIAALEGCLGETLFNGVWRFKATSFEPATFSSGRAGYKLSVEMRNGSNQSQLVANTGFSMSNADFALTPADGNAGIWETSPLNFIGKSVQQGALLTYTFNFVPSLGTTPEDLARPPAKFVLRIRKAQFPGVNYTVPDPSFRIKLDCQK